MQPQNTSPTANPALSRQPGNIALTLIFTIMLMDIVGISILFPVSAYIVQQYSSQALMVTLLNVIYAAAQFLAAPVLGNFSDRYGRRPVLLVSLFGAALGYLIFGLGGALWILLLARLIAGITGGNMSAASAYIADVSKPEELTKNLGLVGLAWGVGLVVGPALGGIFGQIDLRAPAFIAAALALVNMSLSFFLLPESLPKERRVASPMRAGDFIAVFSIRDIARVPGMGVLLVVWCLYNFGFNGMNSIETLFFIRKFSAQPWQIGLVTMLAGGTIAFVQTVLVQRLVKRLGEKKLAAISLVLQAGAVILTFFSPVFLLIYPIVVLRTAVGVSIFPALGALNTGRVSPAQLGTLMGVTTSLGSLMSIFSPVLAGLLYDHVSPGAPYWVTAALFAAAALLLSNAKRNY